MGNHQTLCIAAAQLQRVGRGGSVTESGMCGCRECPHLHGASPVALSNCCRGTTNIWAQAQARRQLCNGQSAATRASRQKGWREEVSADSLGPSRRTLFHQNLLQSINRLRYSVDIFSALSAEVRRIKKYGSDKNRTRAGESCPPPPTFSLRTTNCSITPALWSRRQASAPTPGQRGRTAAAERAAG